MTFRDFAPAVGRQDHIRAGLAVHLVAASTGLEAGQIGQGNKAGHVACRARWMALYLAHVAFGWPLERVADAFGLNRSTASAACRWIEDERDRPGLDGLLERLERCLRDIGEAPRGEWLA